MGKLDNVKAAADLAKLAIDAAIAVADARRRQREEDAKRASDEKDRRIKELEAENARLKKGAGTDEG